MLSVTLGETSCIPWNDLRHLAMVYSIFWLKRITIAPERFPSADKKYSLISSSLPSALSVFISRGVFSRSSGMLIPRCTAVQFPGVVL